MELTCMDTRVDTLQKTCCQREVITSISPSFTRRHAKKFKTKYINKLNSSCKPMRKYKTRLDEMEMRKRNGMLERSCPSKKTSAPECLFDSSHANICKTGNPVDQIKYEKDEPWAIK
jgi:hypothetical protein